MLTEINKDDLIKDGLGSGLLQSSPVKEFRPQNLSHLTTVCNATLKTHGPLVSPW